MNAQQPGAILGGVILKSLANSKGRCQGFVWQGHGCRHEGSDALCRQIGGHLLQTFRIGVGKIGAHTAVNVDVHQSGDHRCALQIYSIFGDGIRQYLTEHAVDHLESACPESEILSENSCVFIKHGILLLCVTFRLHGSIYTTIFRCKKQYEGIFTLIAGDKKGKLCP